MRPGDLTSGSAKLHKAWQKLLLRWDETKLQWRDAVSQEFEEKHLLALEPQIVATLERMRALAGALGSAEQECDENRGLYS